MVDCPDSDLGSRGYLQLGHDVGDVPLRRAVGDYQSFGNLVIAQASGEQSDDLALTRRESGRLRRISAPQRQLKGLRRRHSSTRLARFGMSPGTEVSAGQAELFAEPVSFARRLNDLGILAEGSRHFGQLHCLLCATGPRREGGTRLQSHGRPPRVADVATHCNALGEIGSRQVVVSGAERDATQFHIRPGGAPSVALVPVGQTLL